MKPPHLFITILSIFVISSPAFSADHKGEILEPKFNYQIYNGDPYVFSIGYIKNNSENPLEDITVAIQYYDQNGELVDAAFENLYSFVVPPNEKVAFKVQSIAAREKEYYVMHDVRIVSAAHEIPCNQNTRSRAGNLNFDFVKKILISWFPLLLIIIVWIVLARKYSGKGSNQRRLVELMEQQVKYDEERNREITNIAEALRTKQSNND